MHRIITYKAFSHWNLWLDDIELGIRVFFMSDNAALPTGRPDDNI